MFALPTDNRNLPGFYRWVTAPRAGIMYLISHRNADLKSF
ncbi:hypothetical protein BRAS3843_520266 [Bradyrhizobium sp. STM 3843]|nr:hypothetical protein BRAS3843_520266 [Bradyrhizobium sp. STM 3843]